MLVLDVSIWALNA